VHEPLVSSPHEIANMPLINYCHFSCSLSCYQSHKEKCLELQSQKEDPATTTIVEDTQPARINLFTTIDTVPAERLQELDNSEELKNLLSNPHLRSFIQQIHTASNPWNAMKLAMMEPLFIDFANECLKVVENEGSSWITFFYYSLLKLGIEQIKSNLYKISDSEKGSCNWEKN